MSEGNGLSPAGIRTMCSIFDGFNLNIERITLKGGCELWKKFLLIGTLFKMLNYRGCGCGVVRLKKHEMSYYYFFFLCYLRQTLHQIVLMTEWQGIPTQNESLCILQRCS